MPLYEYECESCHERFEKIRKFSDPPLETCTLCGAGPIRKLFSSPAIQFKGSGFYITDYAKKSTEGQTAGGPEKKSGGSEGDTSAKSDATPASTSDKKESSTKSDAASSKTESSGSSGSSGDGAAARTATKAE